MIEWTIICDQCGARSKSRGVDLNIPKLWAEACLSGWHPDEDGDWCPACRAAREAPSPRPSDEASPEGV